MQPQGLVDVAHDGLRNDAYVIAEPLDRDRADLFSLGFRVALEACIHGWKQDLKRVDAFDVGGHGHDGDDATSQPRRRGVGGIVTDHDCRPAFARLRSTRRIEIDKVDVAAPDQDVSPSPLVASQSAPSSSCANSSQADS